jgi:hypothetical protein
VNGVDSLIRERLAAAAAFDVNTDLRHVAENVAQRQRRIRRRRRTVALLGVLIAAGLGIGVDRAVRQDSGDDDGIVRANDTPIQTAPAETSDDARAPRGSAPQFLPEFLPAPGWETSQTGLLATAANVPLGPDALGGNFPAHETVRRLQEGDVLIQAAFIAPLESWEDDAARGFPPRSLPLSLDAAAPHTSIEGSPDVWADRLGATVNGWNIDVLVFYGGTDLTSVPPVRPTAEARAAAQEQLARLVVPAPL